MFVQDWWTFSNDSWSARDQVYEDSRIVSPDKVNWQKLVTVRLITLHFISKSVRRMLTVSVQLYYGRQCRTTYHGVIQGEEVDENDNVIGEAYPYEYAVGQEWLL